MNVWIMHDDDGPYGIVDIYGVYATRKLAVEAAEKRARENERTEYRSIEWEGDRLIGYYIPIGWQVEADELVAVITEHFVVE